MSKPVIVADSGPLIALARINQLELLPKLFPKIIIPPAVWSEVTERGKDRPGAQDVASLNWIEKQTPTPESVESISILVDRGEAEVIALGRSLPDCILLLDDSRARRVAERFNLRRIGTVGVLRSAKRNGFIDALRPLLNLLQENNIYISQRLINVVLQDVGE